jgi:hypothetical protein
MRGGCSILIGPATILGLIVRDDALMARSEWDVGFFNPNRAPFPIAAFRL